MEYATDREAENGGDRVIVEEMPGRTESRLVNGGCHGQHRAEWLRKQRLDEEGRGPGPLGSRSLGPIVTQVSWNEARTVPASKDGHAAAVAANMRSLGVPAALAGFGRFAAAVLVAVPRQITDGRRMSF